jgi:hypothetical protein
MPSHGMHGHAHLVSDAPLQESVPISERLLVV